MLTFFQPKTSYAASPSDIPYWAGLIPPNDTSMRFSLYRSMYSPGASMNRPVDQPFQSRPSKDSTLRRPKSPSIAELSGLRPFLDIDLVIP